MTMQLKKILAVLCLAAAGTVMSATPTGPIQPSTPTPLTAPLANGTITGFTLSPTEIFDDQAWLPYIDGKGSCGFFLDVGEPNDPLPQVVPNKATNIQGLPYSKSLNTSVFKIPANENEHMFKVFIIPQPPCKTSTNATALTANIKVKRKPTPTLPLTTVVAPPLNMPYTGAHCPAPYLYQTGGTDGGKGEFYCQKYEPTCPAGWEKGAFDAATGTLTCKSSLQPTVACPKSTPSWPLGASYYKESWDKMGCKANNKVAN